MKSVGIYFRKSNAAQWGSVDDIISLFTVRNTACKVVNDVADLEGVEVLMVFGGDGTILKMAAACALRGIKIIGVNYGHTGFLAEFEPERMEDAVELVCSGRYDVRQCSMLQISFKGKTYYALNDLVIQRCTSGNMFSNTISLRAAIDGSVVDNYTADGLIVSTPTGSTAYSLAAGGSVLTPDIGAFIMTPVCAHSLHSRPVVYSDRSVLSIVRTDSRGAVTVVVDGVAVGCDCDIGYIEVKKADKKVSFITRYDTDFFNKLLIKLNIWSK